MSDIKCPVCGEKIEHIEDGWCNCKNRCLGSGSIDLWLNFIRTRKALDVAKERLKNTILDAEVLATPEYLASRTKETLAEITALEQNDHFADVSKMI